MNFKIEPPVKPETQTARMALNLTPTLKSRVAKQAKTYGVSANSMVCQLVDAGLRQLEKLQDEEEES